MTALVITLDLQILGQRHKDIKNGLSAPPKPTLATMAGVPLPLNDSSTLVAVVLSPVYTGSTRSML